MLPHDVSELALDVRCHRVVLSYEALADDIDADAVITRVLGAAPGPEVVLQDGGENIPALTLRHTRRAAPVRAFSLPRSGNLR